MKKIETLKKIMKEELQKIDLSKLERFGPQGGTNARNISGWIATGDGAWSLAARQAGVPRCNYWSGSAPTPSQAIPELLYDAVEAHILLDNNLDSNFLLPFWARPKNG